MPNKIGNMYYLNLKCIDWEAGALPLSYSDGSNLCEKIREENQRIIFNFWLRNPGRVSAALSKDKHTK